MEISFFPVSSRSSSQRREICEQIDNSHKFTKNYMDFDYDYFDNVALGVGYGGYKYDGRYSETVRSICRHYNLKPGDRVLEIGCAKGFILTEFFKLGMEVHGVDYSSYAVQNAHPDIKEFIMQGDASKLRFEDNYFDFVLAKEVLPHINEESLESAIKECMRVSKGNIFFEIQVGKTQKELEYMQLWDATHKVIKTPEWWINLFNKLNYKGDFHFKVLIDEND